MKKTTFSKSNLLGQDIDNLLGLPVGTVTVNTNVDQISIEYPDNITLTNQQKRSLETLFEDKRKIKENFEL
ncbi:MAG: hypothetical protein IH934_06230 [Nanoarchaeota archaeon]|nr:hypothetical protein [Nanoarchaeota archaeon]